MKTDLKKVKILGKRLGVEVKLSREYAVGAGILWRVYMADKDGFTPFVGYCPTFKTAEEALRDAEKVLRIQIDGPKGPEEESIWRRFNNYADQHVGDVKTLSKPRQGE